MIRYCRAAVALALTLFPASAFAFRPCEVESFSSGGPGTCALRFDGRLACWGDNYMHTPLSTIPDGLFTEVSVGYDEACGVRTDGSTVCWGKGFAQPEELTGKFRQVSAWAGAGIRLDGTLSPLRDSDISVALPEGFFLDVTGGINQACARRADRTVVCWYGAEAPSGTFQQIDAGYGAACGVRDNGDLKCWGANATTPGGKFTRVSLRQGFPSEFAASALRDDGKWIFWNEHDSWTLDGEYREIEYGNIPSGVRTSGEVWIENQPPPGTLINDVRAILPMPGPFTQVSVGGGTGIIVCGLDLAGYASCTGGTNVGWTLPPHERFRQIAVGLNHACAIREDGSVACWGNGQTQAPDGEFVQIDSGETISCGLRESGAAECWWTELGGELYPFETPAGPFTTIAYGRTHGCGLGPDGEATCWEYDDEVPNFEPASGPFEQISAAGSTYFEGKSTSCGLHEDGTISCWGDSDELNAQVPEGEFLHVVTAESWACGLRPDGHVECWAEGGGLDAPDREFTSIDASGYGVCGLEADGTISCWSGLQFTSFCGVALPDCGDGDLDAFEDCDNGATDWTAGAACDDRCATVPCGRPLHPDAASPSASDALFTLHAAVGSNACDASVCDVTGKTGITSTDALAILRNAVGLESPLTCPA